MAERKKKDDQREGVQISPVEEDLEELRGALEDATRKNEEYLGLLQRLQADFQNYRKRIEQEREEQTKSIKANVIVKILPVLDDFERALDEMPEKAKQEDWVQGILLIERKLRGVLQNEGVTKVDAKGKEFNPWEHEAVMHRESSDKESGDVVEVFREGYKLDDKIIRPAQVIVGKGKG